MLVGVNLRATGQFDGSTVAIACTRRGCRRWRRALLAWVVGIWIPLLAVAVTWTMIRALRTHAGSQTFAVALAVAMPLFAVLAIISTVITFTVPSCTELLGWVLFAGMALLLAAGSWISRCARPPRHALEPRSPESAPEGRSLRWPALSCSVSGRARDLFSVRRTPCPWRVCST